MDIQSIIISIPAILICITVHEASHGLAGYLLGDDTAKNAGRITLNPISHIDPIGFLCLIFFRFGWAKPVPYSPWKLKNPKVGGGIIAFAGPLSNFLLALFCLIVIRIIFTTSGIMLSSLAEAFVKFFEMTASISIGLGVFNLLPIPPLDGSKILFVFLPDRIIQKFYEYQQFFYFGMLVLLYMNILIVPLRYASNIVWSFLFNIAFIGL